MTAIIIAFYFSTSLTHSKFPFHLRLWHDFAVISNLCSPSVNYSYLKREQLEKRQVSSDCKYMWPNPPAEQNISALSMFLIVSRKSNFFKINLLEIKSTTLPLTLTELRSVGNMNLALFLLLQCS